MIAPQKKSYDQSRQLITKQRHYFAKNWFATTDCQLVFPVVMYGCETWTVRKAEHQRTDALNYGVGEDS